MKFNGWRMWYCMTGITYSPWRYYSLTSLCQSSSSVSSTGLVHIFLPDLFDLECLSDMSKVMNFQRKKTFLGAITVEPQILQFGAVRLWFSSAFRRSPQEAMVAIDPREIDNRSSWMESIRCWSGPLKLHEKSQAKWNLRSGNGFYRRMKLEESSRGICGSAASCYEK